MSATAYSRLFWQGFTLGLRGFSGASIRAAGLKRSLGFFLQPVENWSRYPELTTVARCLGNLDKKKVLDLGSPKMLGLLLAQQYSADCLLTDIWDVAVKEVSPLCERNKAVLRGSIALSTADLTQLPQQMKSQFDVVYSVSVVEHIADTHAIKQGLTEMGRVCRQGGKVVVSVPIRKTYFAQYFESAVYGQDTEAGKVFFSHYFDATKAREIFGAAPSLTLEKAYVSTWKLEHPLLKFWCSVPPKIRGLFGFVNMLIAPKVTELQDIGSSLDSCTFPDHGDLILEYRKV